MNLYANLYREIKREERLSESNLSDLQNKVYEEIDLLIKELPHGSGIDYDYEVDAYENKLIIKNGFTVYNDSGYRMGTIDFRVIISPSFDTSGFDLKSVGNFTKFGYKYCAGLKEYLYDVYYNI